MESQAVFQVRTQAKMCSIELPPREGSLQQSIFAAYARTLTRWPSKVIVALVTAGILGMSLYGNYFLEHEFDPLHFLPKDSYLMRFINTRNM